MYCNVNCIALFFQQILAVNLPHNRKHSHNPIFQLHPPPLCPPSSRYVRSSAPAAVGGRGGGVVGDRGAAAPASLDGSGGEEGRGRGRVGEGFKRDL